ncbi:MAG: tetratricopeptide repeat-containing sulfotransferase family protein [Phycisphaerales bacterium JB061]
MHFNPQIEQMIQDAGKLAASGRWTQALALLDQVRKADPGYVNGNGDIQLTAAMCLNALGRHRPAEAAFLRTIELKPKYVHARVELALLYSRIGDDRRAYEQLGRAIEIEPENSYALRQLANWHMDQGDYETADRILSPMVALIRAGASSEPGPAYIFARLALATGREQEAYDLLERFTHNPNLAPESRRILFRRMGELCDRLGNYDEAFRHFATSQSIAAKPYDPDQHTRRVDELIAAWTPDAARALPRTATEADPRVVFVLGMPRSGTSLAERIIGAHPEACACGEQQGIGRVAAALDEASGPNRPLAMNPAAMTQDFADRAAESYRAMIKAVRERLGDASASLVTDKQPYNFLHIPIIAAMFPGAKIVHTVREPADACLSSYFQFFGGHHPHTHDLYNLGRFHRDYERLMAHWHSIADDLGVSVLDVSYSDIVGDLETSARAIIDHVGLEWDDACLRFDRVQKAARTASNDQVRKPIYTSSLDRASNYEGHIGALRAGLAGQPRP